MGPYALRGGRPDDEESERQPLLEDPREDHDEPLVDAVEDDEPLKKRVPKKALEGAEEFCRFATSRNFMQSYTKLDGVMQSIHPSSLPSLR